MKSNRLSRQAQILSIVQENTQAMITSSSNGFPGIHAGIIAEQLQMDRANVAKELNKLYQDGQLIKVQGKPTLYICRSILTKEYPDVFFPSTLSKGSRLEDYISSPHANADPSLPPTMEYSSTLDNTVGIHQSLKSVVLQAKAAVMYPSHDMHVLVTGSAGVGRASLVRKMHNYAINQGSLTPDAPFIVVNCREQNADPQLLLSQLLGCTRDAAPKKEKAQRGLIERAAGGILFLNDIDNLPLIVQDALITLLEKKSYSRVGSPTVPRYSNAMIIATSTKVPKASSISALQQRFPIRIHIPDLIDRSLQEIAELVIQAFQREASSAKLSFQMSKDILAVFLRASYPGNLGELYSIIRTTCALMFQDFVFSDPQSNTMKIRLQHLPSELLQEVRIDDQLEFQIQQLFHSLDLEYLIFRPGNFSSNQYAASQFLKLLHQKVKHPDMENSKISHVASAVTAVTEQYFNQQSIPPEITPRFLEKHFPNHLPAIARSVLSEFSTVASLPDIPGNFYLLLKCLSDAIHGYIPLLDTENTIWLHMQDVSPIETACVNALCEATGSPVNNSGRIYLAACLEYLRVASRSCSIPILAIFHGNGIAEAMAEYVNTSLDSPIVTGLSLLPNMSFPELLEKISDQIQTLNRGKGILLAVDMEPLTNLHEHLSNMTDIHTESISNVSLPTLLSLGRFSLEEDITLHELTEKALDLTSISTTAPESTLFNRVTRELLSSSLTFLNPNKAIDALNVSLSGILKELNIMPSNEISIKFIFHGAFMLERLIRGDSLKYDGLKSFLNQNSSLFAVLERHLNYISEVFGVSIPANELAYLAEIILSYLEE